LPVTVPALLVNPVDADWNVMPVGSISVTVTFVAAEGPELVTTIV
jgi:hypothetical protein